LFVALKSESIHIGIKDLLDVIPNVSPESVLELENIVIHGLNYHLHVSHPFDCLYGMYLNSQQQANVEDLRKVYQTALGLLNQSYYTDCILLFTPWLIAFSVFRYAAEQLHLNLEYPEVDEEKFNSCISLIKEHKDVDRAKVKDIDRNIKLL
jgi:hypothetical protein